MTARATAGALRERAIKYLQVVIANAVTIWPGSAIFWDPVAGKGTNAAGAGLKFLGTFSGNAQANPTGKFIGDGATKVQVDLVEEILLTYFANGTAGDAVAATDFLNTAYALDDATASILPAGKSALGVIWDVDTRYGIGVKKIAPAGSSLAQTPTLGAFVAGANAPATLVNGAVYDIPAMAANSTLTLPAASPDGTEVEFTADGTNNGFTLQYVDATGPTNITTALTASKRHLVRAVKLNGKWRANAYVSP